MTMLVFNPEKDIKRTDEYIEEEIFHVFEDVVKMSQIERKKGKLTYDI
jgi:hypothetical protein